MLKNIALEKESIMFKRPTLYLISFIMLLAWYVWPALHAEYEQDRCLDRGGSWQATTQTCMMDTL
jgi:hypothetical protein